MPNVQHSTPRKKRKKECAMYEKKKKRIYYVCQTYNTHSPASNLYKDKFEAVLWLTVGCCSFFFPFFVYIILYMPNVVRVNAFCCYTYKYKYVYFLKNIHIFLLL